MINVAEVDIIYAICDETSLLIFKTIATANTSSSELLKKDFKLTAKQYYLRISRLMKAGLIKREKRRYFLTSLGKVVYEAESMIAIGLHYYWKLKAIDTLLLYHRFRELQPEEYNKIIDHLIENQKIKQILT
jgi:DNA-binding HxlR family transcriptional regulator